MSICSSNTRKALFITAMRQKSREIIAGKGEIAPNEAFLLSCNVFFLSIDKSFNPFPKQQILDSSKLKEFADDNFKFNENKRKLFKQV